MLRWRSTQVKGKIHLNELVSTWGDCLRKALHLLAVVYIEYFIRIAFDEPEDEQPYKGEDEKQEEDQAEHIRAASTIVLNNDVVFTCKQTLVKFAVVAIA